MVNIEALSKLQRLKTRPVLSLPAPPRRYYRGQGKGGNDDASPCQGGNGGFLPGYGKDPYRIQHGFYHGGKHGL
jgi:hypothetical protein